MNEEDILKFWFEELTTKDWYKKDSNLDELIKGRFLDTYQKACKGELWQWRETVEGRLAEIIVLDQFSRNMFRDQACAFKFDFLAVALSQEACRQPKLHEIEVSKRAFAFMPLMHSESAKVHELAVKMFSAKGLEKSLEFELKHKAIIDKFGRYPHRNEILGRKSSLDEIEFLKTPGSTF
ncbi:MAG: hypothetical protein COW01_02640 [Bdellovibrionales bacterium CG12_big_fil_rev_8_21_14_0_65_38_15]|nr:MAG: hypothetical protein COW79_08305 [Bdellovibrionales bacterium CG22_combo_CG10-13_8_21_14_all_38_13]PIQ56990.1 MAG: hypothetical protein COW01_02640 [Bdellovibrionales bacterium CG12_big_fil_rev_8_21_14_0_65_38_15]PIR29049.1 MAG: hypothetical protein COV38_12480 [Bdellovibrionales bacterium CG11_big_fil_rev_8_21_14_0_20_38_13]